MQLTLQQKNEVLAEFMGIKEKAFDYNHGSYTTAYYKVDHPLSWPMLNTYSVPGKAFPEFCEKAKYSTSYDWLMPVWRKFRDMKLDGMNLSPSDEDDHLMSLNDLSYHIANSEILVVFDYLVSCILWLNSLKIENNEKHTEI